MAAATRKLKPLAEQVIVITGATSGIGLTAARMAAEAGATLVLAARHAGALETLADELRDCGAQALAVPADVGYREQIAQLGQAAIDRYGRIDTWINNAGVSIFGRLDQVAEDDRQRLFQTNFWGVVYGSLEAVRRLRENPQGGALINIGSEMSDCALPLQGMYAASKHAVKGFTDALRIEVERDGLPIAVTLVKPAAIDTMFTAHARSYLSHEPRLPPPMYAPEVVAGAILHAAQHPQRDVYVGAASRLFSLANFHMPRLLDRYLRATMFAQQHSERPAGPERSDALHAPRELDSDITLRQRAPVQPNHVHERSPYTSMALRIGPVGSAMLLGGALLAAYKLVGRRAVRRHGART